MLACLLFWELLKPFTGETISWVALWKLLGLGVVAAILVFLAAKNDYRKTYIASYKEASTTRLRIAEHLRKLPMSFFNTKDLSDITTNMMADCSSMESILGENGSTLSGGERQRISIARALLKDAPIILLDEATASLDPENEVLIQQAIAKLVEGKTVIMIAHRLRTVVDADQILVLDNGRLVEHGTHDE